MAIWEYRRADGAELLNGLFPSFLAELLQNWGV